MRVRFHLLSKILSCSLLCIGLLCLQGVAFAQVYKSYDADGNVVFSDKPSKRSQEVKIGTPNLSDSFKAPPPSPARAAPEAKPASKSSPEPVTQPAADFDPADTNHDGRVSRREKQEQRDEQHRINREKKKAAEGTEE